ncbi:hypothetical protein O181_029985, partial [Austropuccinia psidii MF-1]|nr:hypothetical protein [Austropuccinia psidii MF-1]
MYNKGNNNMLKNQVGGSGSKLPPDVLWSASLSAGVATLLSIWCIVQQLRNYRKPILQRFVVRILFMVPIYSISSLISLYSLNTSFFIDLIRDLYEAFVIYCFFSLLVEYLGGARSLLILLHGRQPTPHPWPISKLLRPMDISDPHTFLNLKRGVFQYVQVKPFLAILTIIFKTTNRYNDGDLKLTSGYTYVSIGYNFSVSLCLYCLAMFWVCTATDLKPFRPFPKFLCVKGIIFFSFWQGFGISILVAIGLLNSSRYTTETLSLAIQDTLICFEMPLFAILHLYAFSHKDFIEPNIAYCGRLPFLHAFRDSILGFKDVLEDSSATFKGTGFSYKTFEPSEGVLHHQGAARERRLLAGLRYTGRGKGKYWLPMAGERDENLHGRNQLAGQVLGNHTSGWKKKLGGIVSSIGNERNSRGYAPLLPDQAAEAVHEESGSNTEAERRHPMGHLMPHVGRWDLVHDRISQNPLGDDCDLNEVDFGEPRAEEEVLYLDARRLEYGDYNSPVVDASQEDASRLMREQEEGLLATHPAAPLRRKNQARLREVGLQTGSPPSPKTSLLHDGDRVDPSASLARDSKLSINRLFKLHSNKNDMNSSEASKKDSLLPEGCIDLLVEDRTATESRTRHERLKGEANRWTGTSPQRVFKVIHPTLSRLDSKSSKKFDDTTCLQPTNISVAKQSREPKVEVVVDMQDDLQATQIQDVDQGGFSTNMLGQLEPHQSKITDAVRQLLASNVGAYILRTSHAMRLLQSTSSKFLLMKTHDAVWRGFVEATFEEIPDVGMDEPVETIFPVRRNKENEVQIILPKNSSLSKAPQPAKDSSCDAQLSSIVETTSREAKSATSESPLDINAIEEGDTAFFTDTPWTIARRLALTSKRKNCPKSPQFKLNLEEINEENEHERGRCSNNSRNPSEGLESIQWTDPSVEVVQTGTLMGGSMKDENLSSKDIYGSYDTLNSAPVITTSNDLQVGLTFQDLSEDQDDIWQKEESCERNPFRTKYVDVGPFSKSSKPVKNLAGTKRRVLQVSDNLAEEPHWAPAFDTIQHPFEPSINQHLTNDSAETNSNHERLAESPILL